MKINDIKASTIRIGDTIVKIASPLILATGESLLVTTTLPEGPSPDERTIEALIALISKGEISNLMGLSILDRAIVYALAYGGLLLLWTDGETIIPLSRIVLLRNSPALTQEKCNPVKLSDHKILKAWKLIFEGKEEEGLKALGSCTYYPVSFRLQIREGPGLPLGYRSEPVSSDAPR